MAEIKIEKKPPVWPWVLLVILIIAIIAYFMYSNDTDGKTMFDNEVNDEIRDTISRSESHGTSAPYMGIMSVVQKFESSISDSTRIGVDSTYTKTAIANLARVVTMKADELNIQPTIALENLKFYADPNHVTTTDTQIPTSKNTYNDFKNVSKDIVTVLETIQVKNYPNLAEEIKELKQTSINIQTNVTTKEQQTTLQKFFTIAKDVVNNLNS